MLRARLRGLWTDSKAPENARRSNTSVDSSRSLCPWGRDPARFRRLGEGSAHGPLPGRLSGRQLDGPGESVGLGLVTGAGRLGFRPPGALPGQPGGGQRDIERHGMVQPGPQREPIDRPPDGAFETVVDRTAGERAGSGRCAAMTRGARAATSGDGPVRRSRGRPGRASPRPASRAGPRRPRRRRSPTASRPDPASRSGRPGRAGRAGRGSRRSWPPRGPSGRPAPSPAPGAIR